MQNQIDQLRNEFYTQLENDIDLDALYLEYFSKKNGKVANLMKIIPQLSGEERKIAGKNLNLLQNELKSAIEDAKNKSAQSRLSDPLLDLTFPEPPRNLGYMHPTSQTIRDMNRFFRYYGFSIMEGPEIETVEYNFRKLNLPEGHPATDLQDTLFVNEPNILLRTHTSSVEARILSEYEPPIRAVIPGKVYRNETYTATNGAFFHQYQGVVVDKGITIKNLMHTLERFHKFYFG